MQTALLSLKMREGSGPFQFPGITVLETAVFLHCRSSAGGWGVEEVFVFLSRVGQGEVHAVKGKARKRMSGAQALGQPDLEGLAPPSCLGGQLFGPQVTG